MRHVILPDGELASHVRMYMVGRLDGEPIHLPASADIQLLVYLNGLASVRDHSGNWATLPPVFLVGANMQPSLYTVTPGSTFLGIVLRPGGFRACFGLPADLVAGQHLPLDTLLPGGVVRRWHAQCMEAHSVAALIQAAVCFLTTMRRQVVHELAMPELSLDDLLQPVACLSAQVGVSARQFERRFLASHGLPLRDFRRLARFSRSLAGLMAQPGRHPRLASVAYDAHYSDQAHFTREFQQFVGTTPSRYLAQRAAADSVYRLWQFDKGALGAYSEPS